MHISNFETYITKTPNNRAYGGTSLSDNIRYFETEQLIKDSLQVTSRQ